MKGPVESEAVCVDVADSPLRVCSTISLNPELTRPPSDQVFLLARTGAKWTLFLQLARYGINAGSTVVLARLLSPTDFGLVGMAATLTTFCQVFADFGLGWVTIQRQQISRDQIVNLFWINAVVGAVLWGSCIATGPLLNSFYRRSELDRIATVIGLSLLISAVAAQPMALLRRQMRLKTLAIIQIVSVIGGGAVGVGMALAGFRYWSIIGQTLTTQFATMLLVIVYSNFRMGFPRRGAGTLELVKIGGFLTAFGFLSYLAKTFDNIVVGRVLGAEQLGFYTRAYFLITLPAALAAGGLADAMMPALAALRHHPDDFARFYRKAVAAGAYIAFPMITGLAITSNEVTMLVYGSKWASVAPILVVLSMGGMFYSVQTFSWLYVVYGKERELFIWGLVMVCSLFPAFLIGVHWGTLGVAAAYSLVTACFLTPTGFYLSHRCCRMPLLPTVRSLARPVLATTVMALGVWGVGAVADAYVSKTFALLALKVAVGLTIYTCLCAKDLRALYVSTGRWAEA